jgi:hypothetical protein
MTKVYGVRYIEIDFGERPWGWILFLSQECAKSTAKEDSKDGPKNGHYLGPVRPLYLIEIPYDSLDEHTRQCLDNDGVYWTDDDWQPDFTGQRILI